MAEAILKITDGTEINTIDFLSRHGGYFLCDWRPGRPGLNSLMNKNWLSGTEVPFLITQNPVIDTFTLNARGDTVNDLIAYEQKLNRILYQASLYWTGDNSVPNPFYLIAQNSDEDNPRYASVFSSQLHDSSNPYADPFFSRNPMSQDLVVAITHGIWLDSIPGQGGVEMYENVSSAIESAITKREQGVFMFNEYSKIPLVSYLSHRGITHLYRGDETSNKMWSNELTGYDLFVTGGASEYTYFGAKIWNAGKWGGERGFSGIYFNIDNDVVTEGPGYQWEYYDGSWNVMEIYDQTEGLTSPGYVFFNMTDVEHSLFTYQSVKGMWVRVKPTSAFSGNIPAIRWKHPSDAMLPYFDVLLAGDANNQIIPDDEDFPAGQTPPIGSFDLPQYDVTEDAAGAAGNTPFVLTLDATDMGVGAGEQENIVWTSTSNPDGDSFWKYDRGLTSTITFASNGFYEFTLHLDGTAPVALVRGIWDVDTGATYGERRIGPDFSIDDTAPVAALTVVNFNSNRTSITMSSDTVDYYEWLFGDGESDTGATTTHTYAEPGVYDVIMNIYLVSGDVVTIEKRAAIYASVGTVAIMTAKRRRGFAPFEPQFSGSDSIAATPPMTDWDWDFGDGTTGTGVEPTKIYTTPGYHTVELTVTDTGTNEHTQVKNNFIYVDSDDLQVGDNGADFEMKFEIPPIPWRDPYQVGSYSGIGTRDYFFPADGRSSYRLYIGTKSLITEDDRLFESYFPASERQYPDQSRDAAYARGVEFIGSQSYGVIYNYSTAYRGKVFYMTEMNFQGMTDRVMCALRFHKDIADVYKGKYKVFIRLSGEIDHGDLFWSAGIVSTNYEPNAYSWGPFKGPKTRRVTTAVTDNMFLTTLELGTVTFSTNAVYNDLNIYCARKDNTVTNFDEVFLHDIVLVPQHEWYAEIDLPVPHALDTRYLITGSITPDGNIRAQYIDESGNVLLEPAVAPGKPLIISGRDTRFTTLLSVRENTTNIPSVYSDIDQFYNMSVVKKVNRYFSSRGSS